MPATAEPAARSRTRGLLTGWLIPVAILLVLVLIIWLAGGFKPASAIAGPQARLGEQIELRRWTVVVHRIALVDTSPDGYDIDPSFRVWVTATLTDDESQPAPLDEIRVAVPGGPQPGDPTIQRGGADSDFGPDVPRALVLDFRWPDRDKPPHLAAPGSVGIVVRDERISHNYIYGDDWVPGAPAGVIMTPVPDRRKR